MESKKSIRSKLKLGHYSKFEKRDFTFIYTLIAFPVLQFAVFWFYVNFSSFRLAFTGYDGAFTLDHFKRVFDAFQTPGAFNMGQMLLRSLSAYGVSLLADPICWITTYVLFRRLRGHYFFRICYLVPGLLGGVIWTTLVKFMVAYDGPVVEMLKLLNIDLPDNIMRDGLLGGSSSAYPTLLAVSFIMGFVGNSVVLTGAFSRIPDEIFESSRLDGASFWHEFFVIVFPCVWPTLATLLTFSLCGIFTADVGVYLYSNGTGEPDMANMGFYLFFLTKQIADGGGNGLGVYGFPAALGVFLTAITVPIVLIGRKGLEAFIEPVEY